MIDLAVKTYAAGSMLLSTTPGINCAATPMEETDDEVFDRLININLRGAWNCMKGELLPGWWLKAAGHCELFVHRRNCWKPRGVLHIQPASTPSLV